jgi:benzoyl-CoA reductase/2-hydroxyglutaryl-CoA dehydratase subunit BcrC/BadD/HgdB
LAFFLAKKSAQGRTDDELRQAIVQANEKRRAWRELQDRKARGLLSPLGYKSAIRAHSVGEDPPAWEDAPRSGRIPILLLGNSLDLESTWRMLEELGFIVVADDLCYGEKMDSEEVEEDGDPFLALSKAALARPPCPRTLQLAERWEDLLAKARSRSARGAILFPTKYCDYYAYEIPILIPLLRKGGLATLVLEMDYGQVSPEQLRTRLEAFRESL